MRAAFILTALGACANIVASDRFFPSYHVRPAANWNNDPNGPVFFNGVYHLFMQYNPFSRVWGNMSWWHGTSLDLVHWTAQPVALFNDQPYDRNGVFSGSMTVVEGVGPVISYTCVGDSQLQCFAYPKNASDPLLLEWEKDPRNPVIASQPPFTSNGDFRDPTTAVYSEDQQAWLMAVGNRQNGSDAAVLLYSSPDFKDWALSNVLYSSPGAGMFECPDFYTLDGAGADGMWAVKTSHDSRDWVVPGYLDWPSRTFTPAPNASEQLYDGGQFYASKSFSDPVARRRVLWGWVAEEHTLPPSQNWASMQSLPRIVTYDAPTGAVKTAPLPELSALRNATLATVSNAATPQDGSLVMLPPAATGTAVEVEAAFTVPAALASPSSSFDLGVAVFISPDGSSQTRAGVRLTPSTGPLNNTDMPGGDYFDFASDPAATEAANVANCSAACAADARCVAWTYVRPGNPGPARWPWSPRCSMKSAAPGARPGSPCCVSGSKGGLELYVNRSLSGTDGSTDEQVTRLPYAGASLPSTLSLSVFVDGSIVEAYAQGGLAVVTSRVYPQDPSATRLALYGAGSPPGQGSPVGLTVSATAYSMGSIWV